MWLPSVLPTIGGVGRSSRSSLQDCLSHLRTEPIYEASKLTVIFHTNAGIPVLAGDMLISTPGPSVRTHLRLPSQPNGIIIPSDAIPNYIPIRMRRKIFVVNDCMAVGASGTALHIGMFIGDLFKEFRHRRAFLRSEIETFLNQYGSSPHGREVMENVGALIMAEATDWSGWLVAGRTNHKQALTQRFGGVVAIGSGASSIIEQAETNYHFGLSQPPDEGRAFPEFGSLALNLILLANMYWKEFTSLKNIFDAWGGAYDLIYQDSTKAFRHLSDYTIVLRLFDVDQADKGIQLWNVFRYERRSDFSFIMMLNNDKLDFFGAKDITASDNPVSVTFDKDDLTMNSQIHISVLAVGKGNRFLQPIIQADGLDPVGNGRQTVFTDFDEEGRLRVLFQSEHDDWLQEQAMSYYKERAYMFS